MNGVGDGVEQVGFSKAGLPVDEQGVVAASGIVGHRTGRRVGEFVGGTHHEALKGVFLRTGKEVGPLLLGFFAAFALLLRKNGYREVGGEQFLQGLLNGGHIPGGDDVPFEGGGGAKHKAVPLQGEGGRVVKPGVEGGGGHIAFHQIQNLGPDIFCGAHRVPPSGDMPENHTILL